MRGHARVTNFVVGIAEELQAKNRDLKTELAATKMVLEKAKRDHDNYVRSQQLPPVGRPVTWTGSYIDRFNSLVADLQGLIADECTYDNIQLIIARALRDHK